MTTGKGDLGVVVAGSSSMAGSVVRSGQGALGKRKEGESDQMAGVEPQGHPPKRAALGSGGGTGLTGVNES